MKLYKYKAIDNAGKYINGKVSAANQPELVSILNDSGLELITFSEEKAGGFTLFNNLSNKDLISIFIHFEQLERSGVSIIDSIYDLKQYTTSPMIRELMQEISEAIKNGSLFSEAIANYPKIFKPIYVGLIAMGEKTGNLDDAFANVIEDLKWNMEIKRKTSQALVGPIFGITIMFIVLGVMTSVVIPKVTSFIATQGYSLPAMTIALIAFSDFFRNYWYIILFFVPVLIFVSKILSKTSQSLGIAIDALKLKIPLFGPILEKIDSAKFCQFFSVTFKSGLSVIDCLELSSQLVSNKYIKSKILQIEQDVSDGVSIAKAVEKSRAFPHLVSRMFKVGEDSGNMNDALINIKYFFDREINDTIDRLTKLIQPSLTLVMGGMIAWITIAVFGPVYATFSNLN